jgi:hypothetical protein
MDLEKLNLTDLAQKIARYLDGWTWKKPCREESQRYWQTLAGPDGAQLHLGYDDHRGRLEIGGVYPRDGSSIYPWNDQDRPGDITISARRDPQAIAKDIQRRFLPAYLAAYLKGLEMLHKAKAYQDAKKELAARLAALCGADLDRNGVEFTKYHLDSFGVQVRVDSPDQVLITIAGLQAHEAATILTFVRSHAVPRTKAPDQP